jgi:3-isopropylmalate/(R)-2-methylmalate dehydratase large subunit
MAMTIIEKILSRHAGGCRVSPGDIVVCDIDMAVQTDLGFIYSPEVAVPRKVHDPDKVAIVLDHRAPAKGADEALGHARARDYARKWGIRNFYDIGRHGICHQVIMEQALALPGQILVCSDSHTLASGALNCAARGFGTLDLTQVFAEGRSWFRCAPTGREGAGSVRQGHLSLHGELAGQHGRPVPGIRRPGAGLPVHGPAQLAGHDVHGAQRGLCRLSRR